MRSSIRMAVIPMAAVLLLAGCESREPYRRTDVWQPTGANAANLAAMVANPHDLIRGHGATRQLSKESVVPVEKVWQGATSGGGSAGSSGTAGGSSATSSGGG